MNDLLTAEGVAAGYGGSVVLEDVSFSLPEGGSLALLGRNGAGKTTLLLTLMGITRLRKGRIRWRGADLTLLPVHRRARAGLGWVPQERCVFPSLTVEEHLEVVALPGEWTLDRVYGLFPRLKACRRRLGNQLSGGEQQMLAIGRALMARPKLLLLDEPSMGLAPMLVAQIFTIITEINEQGTTILLVEQNAAQALARAHRAYVLETGRIVKEGGGHEMLDDEAVQAAYLGGDVGSGMKPEV
jgi:branched-chain amino acid transport system ATP-binding protein